MNTRLSQDAADTMAAYEQQQRWRADVRARMASALPATGPCIRYPDLTEQERMEREQQINAGTLPF